MLLANCVNTPISIICVCRVARCSASYICEWGLKGEILQCVALVFWLVFWLKVSDRVFKWSDTMIIHICLCHSTPNGQSEHTVSLWILPQTLCRLFLNQTSCSQMLVVFQPASNAFGGVAATSVVSVSGAVPSSKRHSSYYRQTQEFPKPMR